MTIAEATAPRVREQDPSADAGDSLLQPDEVYEHLVSALQQRDRRIANLEAALTSNRTIGVAMGILMATLKCPRDEAFAALVMTSNDMNLKLAAVAEYVEQTGTLPHAPAGRRTRPARRRAGASQRSLRSS